MIKIHEWNQIKLFILMNKSQELWEFKKLSYKIKYNNTGKSKY